jgi:hypothetical protein
VTPLRLDMTDEPFMTQLAGLFDCEWAEGSQQLQQRAQNQKI